LDLSGKSYTNNIVGPQKMLDPPNYKLTYKKG